MNASAKHTAILCLLVLTIGPYAQGKAGASTPTSESGPAAAQEVTLPRAVDQAEASTRALSATDTPTPTAADVGAPNKATPVVVSLMALLARSESFNEVVVTTQGFLTLEFEGTALYLNASDWKAGLLLNAVDVTLLEQQDVRWKDCDRSYVDITGTFIADKGTHGLYSGTIKRVTEIRKRFGRRRVPGKHDGKCK